MNESEATVLEGYYVFARESIPVSHMNGSANSDRLYREKLAHTIETCAEKLGKTVVSTLPYNWW